MLLALLAAISNGSFEDRLSAAHSILNWRSDFKGVTRAAAAQYTSLLKVTHRMLFTCSHIYRATLDKRLHALPVMQEGLLDKRSEMFEDLGR